MVHMRESVPCVYISYTFKDFPFSTFMLKPQMKLPISMSPLGKSGLFEDDCF
jgi:hypothetical protein